MYGFLFPIELQILYSSSFLFYLLNYDHFCSLILVFNTIRSLFPTQYQICNLTYLPLATLRPFCPSLTPLPTASCILLRLGSLNNYALRSITNQWEHFWLVNNPITCWFLSIIYLIVYTSRLFFSDCCSYYLSWENSNVNSI